VQTSLKDFLIEAEGQALSKATADEDGDAGPPPALHAPAQKPVFAGIREAAILPAPAASSRAAIPNESAAAHSIVQTLRMQATRGGGTAVITLAPKYLGSVTVSLRVTDGGVTATLHAENSSVRAWIESNVPLLKDGLAEQGLRLEKIVVSETPEPYPQAEHHGRDPEQRAPAPARRPRAEKNGPST
jgi:flagellar hook-length control protein FliK